MVIFFVTIGLVAERVFKTFFINKYYKHDNVIAGGDSKAYMCNMDKFNATLMKAVPDVGGLFVFVLVAYFSYFTFIWTTSQFLQLLFLAILMTVTLVRTIIISSRIVLSPSIIRFRILPMHCATAKTVHRFIIWTGGYMIIAMMFSVVTFKLGAELSTLNTLRLFFATLILFMTAVAIILYRGWVKNQILAATDDTPTWGRQKFASVWHILALFYIFILWFMLINTMDNSPETRTRGAFFLSFFIVPIWLVADRIMQWIVNYSVKTLKIYDESVSSDLTEEQHEQHAKGQSFYLRCRNRARVFLVAALAIWLASLWGITVPFFSKFTTVFFDTAIILTVALIFWQFISSWIENKIADSLPEAEEEKNDDDEWGSAASRTRSYTLLPMIRKFIATVLIVMVSMTILSSMGVNIGPLLAGAGVIGLAIGFGAQKLVADMFSGFFYLLDDAFRVGEYLEAGSVSGTVENITLRNILLRHHRGMLQIVPHSELGAITNFMRGGIVVKFNLDFPYDANIDQIRKVIKKVGLAMLEDEEFGQDFIRPVKSQGVRDIADSVMTIRVKFTAQPGSQFVIRREAYKRITEALHVKGIHYAHKKVIVDLPQTTGGTPTEDQKKAAGAAAMQSLDKPQIDGSQQQEKGP